MRNNAIFVLCAYGLLIRKYVLLQLLKGKLQSNDRVFYDVMKRMWTFLGNMHCIEGNFIIIIFFLQYFATVLCLEGTPLTEQTHSQADKFYMKLVKT